MKGKKLTKEKTKQSEETPEESIKIVPSEDVEIHPELSRIIEEPIKPRRHRKRHFVTKKRIEQFNNPLITKIILGFSIVLSFVYITFGILGILAIAGLKESGSWQIYEATSILGWNQMKITGFILVIIGIVMFWAVPYYLSDRTQKGDSYLVIGAGVGVLFGGIYLLVILADVLIAAVTAVTESVVFQVETFFYIPIILSILAIPLFRILTIRHIIVLPGMDDEFGAQGILETKDNAEEPKHQNEKWQYKHHYPKKHQRVHGSERRHMREKHRKHRRHKHRRNE
ncbi:MAG: hypothetical protein KGD59_07680 [Candidatus Heimdallarchaeota archaeon]|nr:hypothetical protein [Candidatus Heimdallarchaeota archaeon]MBY8994415.1 hypothetical protein [Candidatus Heimdallarchaeota archaeon]